MTDRTAGDLAIVLHSHMPYVEGYGTYPFGEEWLFEAFARSHLPVLDVADRLTMTITPVLADQLEAEEVGERMLAFLGEHRVEAATRDAAEGEADLRLAAEANIRLYASAIERLESLEEHPLLAFQEAAESGRVVLIPSAATHAVLPKLATQAGRRLQVDAGLRSHERRFGTAAQGFWLPECAYVPGLEGILAEHALAYTCLDQSAQEGGTAALTPVRLPGGTVGFTIDWPTVELVWSEGGYPSDPTYLEYHRLSANGMRLWSISGEPYDPAAAADRASEHASMFLGAVRDRLEQHREAHGKRGLCVFAIDTELLGHWWAEGPIWLREVLRGAEGEGVRLLTLPEALREHEPEGRPVGESSWGEGKSLETWDSPAVSDLVWATRRSELRLLRALRARSMERPAAERAARELLALQSSDWAFMDHRGQAGDYPYTRATAHAQALLEAIDNESRPDPLLGVPAADRGWPGPSRPQALRGSCGA
jgi:1,4-alpha-glucan branching enzyme